MAEYTYEHFTRVDFVPTITAIAAPTVAQLNAGDELSDLLTKDGLQTPSSQNMVDNGTLADRFDAQGVGTYGGTITLKMRRESASDAAWAEFGWKEAGYIVVRRGLAYDAAWAAGQDVEVYPAESGQKVMDPSAANANQTFTVTLAVTSEPDMEAIVAA